MVCYRQQSSLSLPAMTPHLDDTTRSQRWRLAALFGLVLLGFALAAWQPLALAEIIEWGQEFAQHPAAVPMLITVQALLLALALPGTLLLWMVAPFFNPLAATLILTTGSTLGALGAYGISAWLGQAWRPDAQGGKLKRLLSQQSDFLTQLALRVFPGFPHSVVNYTAGALRLTLPRFVLAAVIGLGIKGAVYASAVHGLVQAGLGEDNLDASALAPLFIIAVLLLLGRYVRHRLKY